MRWVSLTIAALCFALAHTYARADTIVFPAERGDAWDAAIERLSNGVPAGTRVQIAGREFVLRGILGEASDGVVYEVEWSNPSVAAIKIAKRGPDGPDPISLRGDKNSLRAQSHQLGELGKHVAAPKSLELGARGEFLVMTLETGDNLHTRIKELQEFQKSSDSRDGEAFILARQLQELYEKLGKAGLLPKDPAFGHNFHLVGDRRSLHFSGISVTDPGGLATPDTPPAAAQEIGGLSPRNKVTTAAFWYWERLKERGETGGLREPFNADRTLRPEIVIKMLQERDRYPLLKQLSLEEIFMAAGFDMQATYTELVSPLRAHVFALTRGLPGLQGSDPQTEVTAMFAKFRASLQARLAFDAQLDAWWKGNHAGETSLEDKGDALRLFRGRDIGLFVRQTLFLLFAPNPMEVYTDVFVDTPSRDTALKYALAYLIANHPRGGDVLSERIPAQIINDVEARVRAKVSGPQLQMELERIAILRIVFSNRSLMYDLTDFRSDAAGDGYLFPRNSSMQRRRPETRSTSELLEVERNYRLILHIDDPKDLVEQYEGEAKYAISPEELGPLMKKLLFIQKRTPGLVKGCALMVIRDRLKTMLARASTKAK